MSIAEGAAAGAATGSVGGPWGTVIGAGIGAGASLLGGKLSADRQDEMAMRNMMMQLAFAKNAIQWKAEDARAAGIHPLYALGASTQSFSPVSIGGNDVGSGLAAAGQDIGRALMATSTAGGRRSAFSDAAATLQLDGLKLDNDIKRARLASMAATVNQAGTPPSLPVPEADKFEDRPALSMGDKMQSDPRTTNQEDAEKRYGDSADWVEGLYNRWRDTVLNFGTSQERAMANPFHSNPRRLEEAARNYFYRKMLDYRYGRR